MLGLDVEEINPSKNTVMKNLENGNPIICIMGPGNFTDKGHFIVLTDWTDGKITIHDPNSMDNSCRMWEYEEIESQIRNMWVYQAG